MLVTLNDKKLGISSNNSTIDYFNPQVVSAQDYYPFGMLQPGRSVNTGVYRFGFNGQEMNNDVKGVGNSYTALFWEYDSRIGRRWNIDPVYKHSPYECFGSNPIRFIDNDGRDSTIYMYSYKSKVAGSVVEGPGKKAVTKILNNVKRIMEANGLTGLKYKVIEQEDFTSGKLKLDPSDAILGITGSNGGESSNGESFSYPNQAAVPTFGYSVT